MRILTAFCLSLLTATAVAQWQPEQCLTPDTTNSPVCLLDERGIAATGLLSAEPSSASTGDLRLLQQSTRPAPPSAGVIFAEAGGGLAAGTIVGAGLGLGLAVLVYPTPSLMRIFPLAIGGAIGYTAGCPVGVTYVGDNADQEGKFLPALLGSTAGVAAAVGVAFLGSNQALLLSAAALAPAGAVIGYNLSRPKPDSRGSLDSRLELPRLTMRRERVRDRSSLTVLDARLVSLRF